MNKLLRTLATIAFALLQCIAPLVHAHVDGIQSSASNQIHIEAIKSLAHDAINEQCVAEEDESAAVSLPQECQRDIRPVVPYTPPELAHPTPPALYSAELPPEVRRAWNDAPFLSPLAQAPPAQ